MSGAVMAAAVGGTGAGVGSTSGSKTGALYAPVCLCACVLVYLCACVLVCSCLCVHVSDACAWCASSPFGHVELSLVVVCSGVARCAPLSSRAALIIRLKLCLLWTCLGTDDSPRIAAVINAVSGTIAARRLSSRDAALGATGWTRAVIVVTDIDIKPVSISDDLHALVALHRSARQSHVVTVHGLSPDSKQRVRVMMEPMLCSLTVVLQALAKVRTCGGSL